MTPADRKAIGEAAIALARTIPGGDVSSEARARFGRALGRPHDGQRWEFLERIEHAIRAAFDAGAESVSQAVTDPPSEVE